MVSLKALSQGLAYVLHSCNVSALDVFGLGISKKKLVFQQQR
jgi:hypothetical protein